MGAGEVVLTQYVVYENPRDAPGMFVVREWHIARGHPEPVAGEGWVVRTVEDARALIPPGLVCLGRQPDDDVAIVEVWT